MAHIPLSVIAKQPLLQDLNLRSRGKVRDSYNLPDYPNNMLVVTSDRCSIFDFVLSTLVPIKGEILTALNHFWTKNVIDEICKTDFVACGAEIDRYLPENLRNNVELQKRATVVKIVPEPDVEDIVRIILTGSGFTSYQKTQSICGHKLPAGLTNGALLPYPIYTPTTKAKVGHDEHVTADSVAKKYGHRRERLSLQVALAIASYASKRKIIMADTKFEFSLDDGTFVLADEKGTPDSSRFVDKTAWIKALEGDQFPPSLDKQYVREWGKEFGIDKRNPEVDRDTAYVDCLEVPAFVVNMTTRIYRYIFWRLTGLRIEVYQKSNMGVDVKPHWRKIEIIAGSESDLLQIEHGLNYFRHSRADVSVSVVSCHRNPKTLREFALDKLVTADIVIAGAGMAAALPGIVKSELCFLGRFDIPVIGVALRGKTEKENQAAVLSIECLPGQPVELDPKGNAYFGEEGFVDACLVALTHEFLPRAIEQKPAKIGFKQFLLKDACP